MPRGTRTLTLTLRLDTTRVVEGLRALRDATLRLRLAFGRAGFVQLHGVGNLAGDGTWQSDLCAAWVHESCPTPARCDCTCHGGTVR